MEAPHAKSHSTRQEAAHSARKNRRTAGKDCTRAAAREDRTRAARTAGEDRARAAPGQAVARSRLTRRPRGGSAQGLYRFSVLAAFVGGALPRRAHQAHSRGDRSLPRGGGAPPTELAPP